MRRRIPVAVPAVTVAVLAAMAAGQFTDDFPADFSLTTQPLKATDKFSARPINSLATVAPGDSMHVVVEMTVAEKFWVYGPFAGGKVVPAQSLTIKPGGPLKAGAVLFTSSHEHVTDLGAGDTDTHNVYEGRAYAYVPVTVPVGTQPGKAELPLLIEGQVCDPNVCLQLSTTVTAVIEVAANSTPSPDWTAELAAGLAEAKTAAHWRQGAAVADYEVVGGPGIERLGLLAGLAMAVVAGLLFNVMPCVLPVLPLRLMALLNQAGGSRRRFLVLGLAFAGGILLFFAGIAVAGVVLKVALGYDLTLNDLLRRTPLLVAMVMVLVALAMNLFGAFNVTVPDAVAAAEQRSGPLGAVGTGVVFAILSVPCSAPIIAGLFIWAQLQPVWAGGAMLLLTGVGMAAPHAAIAFFPQVVERLPRAGRWSNLLKEFVGFVILAIIVWLLGTQVSDPYVTWVGAYAVVLAVCLWMWGTWVTLATPAGWKWGIRIAAVAIAVAAGWWMLEPASAPMVPMRAFDAAAIGRARADGKTVLVKFTARWCVECFVVERKIYEDADVAAELKRRGIAAFKGDVTKKEYPASAMLYDRLRQAGPPLTVILPPGRGRPMLLRGVFGKDDLFAALAKAQPKP